MGCHAGLRAQFSILLSLCCFIGSCYNSKITFPIKDIGDSPIKLTVIPEPLTPASDLISSQASASTPLESESEFPYPFFSGDNNEITEESNGLSLDDSGVPEDKGFVRSLEIPDSSEMDDNNPNRKLRDEVDWNGWNFEKNKKWKLPPDEKTIALQIVDDDPYHHGRPAWPHDEYLVGYFGLKDTLTPTRNNASESGNGENTDPTVSPEDMSKYYEWKRLQPRPPPPSAFIGPGFYDVSALSPSSTGNYYRYQQPSYQAITDGTGKVQTTPSASSSGGSSGERGVPGTPSESATNTRHFAPFSPYDFYKRKRLRLQIHPGLIAAPLAGLAAFGAASALTSKPLLVELGYVRNKADLLGGGFPGGGWGFAGTPGAGYRPYPPFYPPPNPPPILPPIGVGTGSIGHGPIGGNWGIGGGLGHGSSHASAGGHGHGGGGPIYPILTPGPGRRKPDSERSSWWNPFSGLTPRLVVE